MAKRRKLQDLYVTGREVKITGPKDSEVVWLQKPSAVEMESVLRRANAARARVLLLKKDRESEEWQATYAEVSDYGDRDALIGYIVQEDLDELRFARDAQMAAAEEWSEDDYLQGLRDAWEGTDEEPGLMHTWMKDPEDPEAKKVYEELKRFTDSVDKEMEAEVALLKKQYDDVDDEVIVERVVEAFLDRKADSAWMRESNRAELFYVLRDASNHSERYFDSPVEVDLLAPQVLAQLMSAYRELKVDPIEGKDSAGTGDSSPSSGQPAPEETPLPSGQPAAVL